jgi:hypothetical protein
MDGEFIGDISGGIAKIVTPLNEKRDFSSVLRQSTEYALKSVIGEGGAKVAFFHLKLGECLDDPEETNRRFTSMFKTGTPVLEKAIVKELQAQIGVVAAEQTTFNFQDSINSLRKESASQVARGIQV